MTIVTNESGRIVRYEIVPKGSVALHISILLERDDGSFERRFVDLRADEAFAIAKAYLAHVEEE